MPVVEVPATNPNETVTLFYSGDGGWRDLDRAVAGQMADLGYPVVGVDTLRYFWSGKTPEKAASDLAATMAYYRIAWKAKTFVLAGYSFGADILPAVYNRLSGRIGKTSPCLSCWRCAEPLISRYMSPAGWEKTATEFRYCRN